MGPPHHRLAALHLLLALAILCLGCAPGGGNDGTRVLVLGLDGMDPDAMDLLISEGKLPHFSELRRLGAYGKLRSQRPILSPIIWTTIATGQTPDRHGIGHFVTTTADGDQLPVTSQMRRVEAIWNIVSDADKSVATVGWWATWPPETVNGSVVSDHTSYHFMFEEGFTGGDDEIPKTHPPELMARIEPLLRRPADLTPAELEPFVDVPPEAYRREFDFQDDFAHFRWALATAQGYRDIGLELWRQDRPDLAMVYIEGTDSTSHLFGHLFRVEELGGELAEQQAKFGDTVEAMYVFADELLGEYMDAMDENTTLMVLSDHGFQLGALHDDPSRTRDLRRVSEKFHRIDGILYLYGAGVRAGAQIQGASILDITPTLLSFLGLPAADDMPGRVLEEAMSNPRPIDRIATYENAGGKGGGADGRQSARINQAQLEHLRSLGYIGGDGEPATTSTPGDRNLAAIHFEQGQYREAAQMFKRLVDEEPDNASLRASLAGALGALERYDLALEQLNRSIEIQPLNIEGHHNRAVIHERLGNRRAAIADYETALRYNPQYEPSQRALERLTGRSDVRAPADKAEARAAALVHRASVEARRASYREALRLLEQAEAEAPRYVLIYQYRSNVAYLMGDLELGIAALERALEIEPGNALFERNLEQLRSQRAP